MSVIIKGFRYFDDTNTQRIEAEYENIGQLLYHIEHNALRKDSIYMPKQNKDGSFDQDFADTFSGQIRYDDTMRLTGPNVSVHIMLIKEKETDKILFSSGDLTSDVGFISEEVKDMIQKLATWKKSPENFKKTDEDPFIKELKKAVDEDDKEASGEVFSRMLTDENIKTCDMFEDIALSYIKGNEDFRNGIDKALRALVWEDMRGILIKVKEAALKG